MSLRLWTILFPSLLLLASLLGLFALNQKSMDRLASQLTSTMAEASLQFNSVMDETTSLLMSTATQIAEETGGQLMADMTAMYQNEIECTFTSLEQFLRHAAFNVRMHGWDVSLKEDVDEALHEFFTFMVSNYSLNNITNSMAFYSRVEKGWDFTSIGTGGDTTGGTEHWTPHAMTVNHTSGEVTDYPWLNQHIQYDQLCKGGILKLINAPCPMPVDWWPNLNDDVREGMRFTQGTAGVYPIYIYGRDTIFQPFFHFQDAHGQPAVASLVGTLDRLQTEIHKMLRHPDQERLFMVESVGPSEGYLLAESHGPAKLIISPTEAARILAINSSDPVTAATARFLEDMEGDWTEIPSNQTFKFAVDTEEYLCQVRHYSYNNLHVAIVVVQQRKLLLGKLVQSQIELSNALSQVHLQIEKDS